MTAAQTVFERATALAGELSERQKALLEVLCTAAVVSLTARLREGVTPEDCMEEFVAAASLTAVSALDESDIGGQIAEFKAGDLTVKRGSTGASGRRLERQAERMLAPYLRDSFLFRGV